jgi:hypothetical protein
VKKAVFVEYSSQDEGVSLSATPGSSTNNTNHAPDNNIATNNNNNNPEEVECDANSRSRDDSIEDNEGDVDSLTHDARNGIPAMRPQQRDASSDVSSNRLETADSMMNAR